MLLGFRRIAISTLSLLIALQALGSGVALAQTNSGSGQGLQISPVIAEIIVDPGKTYNINITVQNVTTGDLYYQAFVNDFRAKDETGAPQVLLNQDLPASLSLVHWFKPIPSLLIHAKQSVVVPVQISIPADTEPGGHYGVIRFSGIAPELKDTGVALSASVGTLVLARVSGQAKEGLQLKDFYALRSSKRSNFFETGPLTFVERLYNSGNVHLKPEGSIIVKDMTGKVVSTLAVNPNGGNILPLSTRRFEQSLNKGWMFGRYHANMSLAYGTGGQVLQHTLTFWVIPYKLIIIVLVVLIAVIWLIIWSVKRYNRKIIKKALKGRS